MNSVALPVAQTESDARLPATYEAARTAIAECYRIDECKTWSDKAAALASYARQAKDDQLRVTAVRIQDRAMRRAGELLKQIAPADESTRFGQVGAHPPVTRTQAATAAGLSEHQRKTALRIATVPAAYFDRQVESAKPPTITQLAEQGKVARPPVGSSSPWSRIECPETRDACEALERFARFCSSSNATGIVRGLNAAEAGALRQCISVADSWLDQLVASLASD